MKKAKAAPTKEETISVAPIDVLEALDALDACEQLLELLKGPLNGDAGMHCDELISRVQDCVIVSARIRLARAVGDARMADFRAAK